MSGMKRGNGADPGGKTEVREPRFKLIPFDMLQPVTKPAYLVKDIIPRTGLVVVWGPPKCGKSFWMTTTMLYVALGWEYRGHKVVQGTVVYCAFEGQDGYGQRAEAFRQHHLPEDADPVPFYLVAAQMNLVKDHAALIGAIELQLGISRAPNGTILSGTVPVAVVLDTLNRSLHGSESEDKDMGAYVHAATAVREAFNCAVVIIHHCGVSGDRPRGHTSLTGAADAQIAVKRDAAGYVIATVEWMKDGPEGTTIASRLESVEVGVDDDGDTITSCIVVPVEDRPAEAATTRKVTRSGRVFHEALVEALDAKGQTIRIRGDGPSVKAVNIEDVRPEFYARYVTSEAEPKKRTAAQRKAFRYRRGRILPWNGYGRRMVRDGTAGHGTPLRGCVLSCPVSRPYGQARHSETLSRLSRMSRLSRKVGKVSSSPHHAS
jgi:hypothetical protein